MAPLSPAHEHALAQKDIIIRRYVDKKVSARRLADQYGVDNGWLGRRLDEWGVVRRTRPTRTPAHERVFAEKDAIIRRYVDKKVSARRLADQYGVSPWWLIRRLDEWRVPLRQLRAPCSANCASTLSRPRCTPTPTDPLIAAVNATTDAPAARIVQHT
ncbi:MULTISPECIES: hypothetical protein [unclassified Streptomyces]|uniref:hypothetical protein n=1 Tax=unclassified Streptomyces TaxID=2593676 RepID=UPI0038178D8E